MKRVEWIWQAVGFGVSTLLGTLLHFAYDWSGKSLWVAPFSGINESTWEHMKLLFWPMLFFAAVRRLIGWTRQDFWCVELRSILLGQAMIPLLFYTYNGVIGKSPDWVNITIFFLAAGVAYLYDALKFSGEPTKCKHPLLPIALPTVLAAAFVLFTFCPPPLNVFRDPL